MVVDHHELIRRSVALILGGETDINVVAECAAGAKLVRAARAQCPDVVLIDLSAPALGGLAATRTMLAASPDIRVVGLTASVSGAAVVRAFAAGAHGYLLKTTSPTELIAAVRAAAAGGTPLSPAAAEALRHHGSSTDPRRGTPQVHYDWSPRSPGVPAAGARRAGLFRRVP